MGDGRLFRVRLKAEVRRLVDKGMKMKVFKVITERDGETTKARGKTSTELVRETFLYAADTVQEVWDAIEWLREDQERTLVELVEVAPAITVLAPSNTGSTNTKK